MCTMQFFALFLFFLHASGFLLDKSGSTSGQSGTSNQYVTSSVFFAESKARHQGDEQLRFYVDQSLSILTSQLEKKFNIVEQKLIKCENQSVHIQAYESLEQQFVDLEHKYVDLERKYNQLKSVNNDLNFVKNKLVSVQNKTSEISNDVLILNQLGNIKPLQEIQTLQKAVQTVSAQTHSLSVNERARSQDFLALYNMTIDSKRLVSELYVNASNQLKDLAANNSKHLLRLEQNLNSTAAGIIYQMEVKETYDNATMSGMQKQINKNAERVAITAHPSSQGTISNTIIKFDNVKFSVGITNMSAYKTTGKFTCELEGLYLISASVLSNTNGANYYIRLNGKDISLTYIGSHSSSYDHTGAVTITLKLHPNDQVWLYAVAMISHMSTSGTIRNTIMAFDDVMFSLGITNLSTFRNTGKFTFEHGGVYIISVSVLSITDNAYYFISLNGNDISRTYVGQHSGKNGFTGAVTITQELYKNDQICLYAPGTWYVYGGINSKLTIIKIK